MPTVDNIGRLPPGKARWPSGLRMIYGEDWLYIGRAMTFYHLPQSPLANDARVSKYGRSGAIEEYRKWLAGQLSRFNDKTAPVWLEMAKIKPETVLLCWCHPQPCHGDIVVRAWEWLQKQEWYGVPIYENR